MTRNAAVLLVVAALTANALRAEPPEAAATLAKLAASVVPVRYTLRPQEAPSGGEGEKVEKVVCGLLISDDGLVVIPGDPFPDPGGDPRLTLEPVAFAVLGNGETEHAATPVGFDRDLNLGYVRLSGKLPPGLSPVRFEREPNIRIGQEIWIVGLLSERYGYAVAFWAGGVNAAVEKPRPMYSLTGPVVDLAIGGLVATPDGRALGLVGEDVLPPPRSPGDLPENALLVFGWDDPGYTASKVYPYILARKPLLSVIHEGSTAGDVIRTTQSGTLVTFGAAPDVHESAKAIFERWFVSGAFRETPRTNWQAFERFTAESMTQRVAEILDSVAGSASL